MFPPFLTDGPQEKLGREFFFETEILQGNFSGVVSCGSRMRGLRAVIVFMIVAAADATFLMQQSAVKHDVGRSSPMTVPHARFLAVSRGQIRQEDENGFKHASGKTSPTTARRREDEPDDTIHMHWRQRCTRIW